MLANQYHELNCERKITHVLSLRNHLNFSRRKKKANHKATHANSSCGREKENNNQIIC